MTPQLDRVVAIPDGLDQRTDSARVVVMASGDGSNLQALIDAVGRQIFGEIVLVVSDQPDAKALRRAEKAGIDNEQFPRMPNELRGDYDRRLAELVAGADPDWIVLAGWMRLLSNVFLDRFPERVINLHPALPGEYPGMHAIERAFADAQAGLRDYTGVMVHLVPDESVDNGPVLAMTEVPIFPDDTLDSLTERVHAAEHDLLVRTVAQLPAVPRSAASPSSAADPLPDGADDASSDRAAIHHPSGAKPS